MKQEESALVINKSELPREANRKTTDSTFDRIYKFYHNDKTRIELTAEETTISERWEKAWFLLCRHRTQKYVVDTLSKLYGIGKSVGYDDVRNAMMLFTDPTKDLKEAKRAIAETSILRGAQRAWKNKNLDMHFKYMKEYAEINGLKENSQDGELAKIIKGLKPAQIIIVANKNDLEKEIQTLQEEISTLDVPYTVQE